MDLTRIWRKAQHNTGLSQKEMAYGAHMTALYSFLKKFGYKKARMPILC
ncbi:hypothetical protein [Loigolactobacillus coryniformis]|nr:hypothetical protein [Loigolactobacillus coryniformis]